MNQTICLNCGTPLDRPGAFCPACGAPEITAASPKIQPILDTAFALLRESRFEEAKTAFEAVLQKDLENASAYFGRLRTRYHITYMEAFDGKLFPNCPTPSGANLDEDVDYRKAMAYAKEKMKAFLRVQAKSVEVLCTDTGMTKNITHQFTMDEVDPNDEFFPYPSAVLPSLQTKSKKRLATAFALLNESHFDEAKAAFEAILTKEPKNVSCYWGRLCARYHITYTEVFDGVFAPSCSAPSGANLTKDTDYKQALQYADKEWRVFLQEHSKYIKSMCSSSKQALPMDEVDPNDKFLTLSKKEKLKNTWQTQPKKIISLFAVFILLTVTLTVIVSCWKWGMISVYASNGLKLRLNRDFTFCVSDVGTCTDADVTVPSKYLGMPVTGIGYSAFRYQNGLMSITIPDSVTSIDGQAFYGCSNLVSITIPDGVTSIGDEAFSHCGRLTSIDIQSNATSIGEHTFSYCGNLTSLAITGVVTSIGDYAFYDCRNLASLSIPDGVTSIGNYAFAGCSSLMSLTIPDSVRSIGDYAFSYCGNLTSLTIPDSVRSIGAFAFRDCSNLSSVTIGNGVTSIYNSAFWDCSNLTSITFGGTKAQWKRIFSEFYIPFTVNCTDGTIPQN